MRALYATNTIVSRDGKALTITFENNTSMTAIKMTRGTALRLISEMEKLLELGEPD